MHWLLSALRMSFPRVALGVLIVTLSAACCCLGGNSGGVKSEQGAAHGETVHVPVASPSAGRDVGGDAATAKVEAPIWSAQGDASAATTQTGLINLSLSNASAARSGGEAVAGLAVIFLWWRARYWKKVLAGVVSEIEGYAARGSHDVQAMKIRLAKTHSRGTPVGRLVAARTKRKKDE